MKSHQLSPTHSEFTMSRTFVAAWVLAILSLPVLSQNPAPDEKRPIDALDSVWIEELTWMEVRDALKAGKTTAIVPTGGVEQNGPYLATGKQNYILRVPREALARHVGGASGGTQQGSKAVAAKLNEKWAGAKTRAHFIPEYYDYPSVDKWLRSQGIHQKNEGLHDGFAVTAIMMTVDPTTVRMKQRIAANKFRINGIELAPAEKTIEWGRKIVALRADATVKAIHKAITAKP